MKTECGAKYSVNGQETMGTKCSTKQFVYMEENTFSHCNDDQILEQVAQKGCGDIKNLTGPIPMMTALGDHSWAERLDNFQRYNPPLGDFMKPILCRKWNNIFWHCLFCKLTIWDKLAKNYIWFPGKINPNKPTQNEKIKWI